MNIQVPTIKTLYRFSECDPAKSYHKKEEHLADMYVWDEYETIEHVIVNIAEYECDYDIPYHDHHVNKIDDSTYQIGIWTKGVPHFNQPRPDRIIDVKIINVLAFNGRHFTLGEEVEVD